MPDELKTIGVCAICNNYLGHPLRSLHPAVYGWLVRAKIVRC